MERILQYDDLIAVQAGENGERLLALQDELSHIVCSYEKQDMVPYTGQRMLLRSGAIQRLKKVQEFVAERFPGARLKVVYAYRHPEIQRKYFEKRAQELRSQFPDITEEELRRRVHLFVAVPDVAGHPTGGAIDVTVTDPQGDLDMGTRIADFSDAERIRTFFPDLTAEQKKNRMLLREAFLSQGFAPFDGEWWHFSYGDREWASWYGRPASLYSPVDFRA